MTEEDTLSPPLALGDTSLRIRRPQRSGVRSREGGLTWQTEKSLATRTQILRAALQCLVEIGYTQITTEKIAQAAGVSRGAMTHHFKSRAEVFSAAAEYMTHLRALEYEDAVKRIKLPPNNTPTFDSMLETLQVLQKHYYGRPTFIALQEMQRGARTDPDLQAVLAPLEQALDLKNSAALLKRFPFWANYQETSQVLRDLFFHSLKGVAINPTPYMKGDRLRRLHHLLASVAMKEMEKAYQVAHGGTAPPQDEVVTTPRRPRRKAG